MHIGEDPPEKLQLTPLERAVLDALAERLGAQGAALMEQAAGATVTARSHSGVGFVTRLRVSQGPALPEAATRRASVLLATHPDLADPAEFCLQFRNGVLASIEAYCNQGLWPEDESRFRFGGPPPH
jgi:hypothetical protein